MRTLKLFCHSLLRIFLALYIDLQCRNYFHLLIDFTSKCQSLLTIFIHIHVRMQNTPKVDELKISWDDDICVLIQKKCQQKKLPQSHKYHMALDIILSVV